MYNCKKCNFSTQSNSEIANHYKYKHSINNQNLFCNICNEKFKTVGGLKYHKKYCQKKIEEKINHICPKCSYYISNNIEKHFNYCNGEGPRRKREKKFISLSGITFEQRYGEERSKQIKEKLSQSLKGKSNGLASTSEKELERRKNISETMKKNKISGGYRKGSGIGKSGWYKGYWCDSSYELTWVIYHLENDIKFERNTKKFEYEYENRKYNYIPDFIKNNEYYEIKGYMDKKNKAKHKQFPFKLNILYEKDLKREFEYVINKYGKNFIELYEKNN